MRRARQGYTFESDTKTNKCLPPCFYLSIFFPFLRMDVARSHYTCVAWSGIPVEGKGHRKGRSFADCAVHHDGSSMALDDLRHNVQSHAQTGDGSLLGIRGPIEALKDFVALLSRDTQAMITNTDRDRLWGGGEIHLDGLGVGRMLDGVAEQVGEDLCEPVAIPDQAGLHRAMHQNAMTGVGLLHGAGDFLQQGVEVHRLLPILQLARLDLGDVQ